MRNFIYMAGVFLSLLMLPTVACAQKLESAPDFYTGYLATTNFDKSNTIKSVDGVLYMIYEDVPIALVRYPAMSTRTEYEIPATVRRICNNAFQGTKFLKTLKLHNQVTEGNYVCLSIGESAFNDSSIENFVVLENDQESQTRVAKKPEQAKRKEVARYDLSGRKTSESSKGIQIVNYSDRTSEIIKKK